MSERVFLKTEFTPVAVGSQVRKAVGGFLRYIQHRDQHPSQEKCLNPHVSGLVKYVAYRDRASSRAELFGSAGTAGTAERKGFTAFVTGALENSRPQLFRGRDGQLHDRRRAVHRMILSPERAEGLDLRQLMLAGTARLEEECGGSLRWLAAIHRNTHHHHIHFVLAGMRQDEAGRFVRVEITKRRLAALKEAVVLEVERQRGERTLSLSARPIRSGAEGEVAPSLQQAVTVRITPSAQIASRRSWIRPQSDAFAHSGAVIALRAVARRYQRRMQRELEDGYRQSQWERAA